MSRISVRPQPILALALAAAVLLPGQAVRAGGKNGELAIVNGDTIRVADLETELARLRVQRPASQPLELPQPSDVLRRLIQNTLLVQEGYRLGLERDATIRGTVEESARRSAVAAMLDSVTLTVIASASDLDEARRRAVRGCIDAARLRHGARLDDALLKSLDFAARDSTTQQALRARQETVASVGDRRLTVHGLWRRIRFTYFHGLAGRDDAAEIRDRFCAEWIDETALALEAARRGYWASPAVRLAARRVERDLVREEALKATLSFTFKPSERDIEAWYQAHPEAFTPAPRLKVESVMLPDSVSASQFRDRLRQGARLRWLAGRTAEVVPGVTPFPTDWLPPDALGLRPQEVQANQVLEPYGVPGGWAVAVITEIEKPSPTPLRLGRERALALMRSERARETLTEALRRLEAAAQIHTAPDAESLIRAALEAPEREES